MVSGIKPGLLACEAGALPVLGSLVLFFFKPPFKVSYAAGVWVEGCMHVVRMCSPPWAPCRALK